MKLQSLIYETMIAIISLIVFFLILSFLNVKKSKIDEKIFQIKVYDSLFSLDFLNSISKSSLSEILKEYSFEIFEEGKIKSVINFSCICDEEKLLFLNNLFKDGINVNGKNIKFFFYPSKFPLASRDYQSDGIIIWKCELSPELIEYERYGGILFICDINETFYSQNSFLLENLFKVSRNCYSNGLNDVVIKKPLFGFDPKYKLYKILTKSSFFIKINENEEFKNFLNLSQSIPICSNHSLLVQKNNNFQNPSAGIVVNYFSNNIVIWSANFFRKNLTDILISNSPEDLKIKKLLASSLLAISKKKIEIPADFSKNLIFYVKYNFNEFLETYLLITSVKKV